MKCSAYLPTLQAFLTAPSRAEREKQETELKPESRKIYKYLKPYIKNLTTLKPREKYQNIRLNLVHQPNTNLHQAIAHRTINKLDPIGKHLRRPRKGVYSSLCILSCRLHSVAVQHYNYFATSSPDVCAGQQCRATFEPLLYSVTVVNHRRGFGCKLSKVLVWYRPEWAILGPFLALEYSIPSLAFTIAHSASK